MKLLDIIFSLITVSSLAARWWWYGRPAPPLPTLNQFPPISIKECIRCVNLNITKDC